MILYTIYDLFTKNFVWREWEKKPEKKKTRETFPVWLPSHPPVYENGGRLFSDVRKHRKQAGPTGRGGRGILA